MTKELYDAFLEYALEKLASEDEDASDGGWKKNLSDAASYVGKKAKKAKDYTMDAAKYVGKNAKKAKDYTTDAAKFIGKKITDNKDTAKTLGIGAVAFTAGAVAKGVANRRRRKKEEAMRARIAQGE